MDGYCFVYVFPCPWEDHCKIGFSRDPLARMQALHRRWFEFFDLDHGALVETETVRDARDLELELRRPLAAHKAWAPLTVRHEAAGHTEWFRGAAPQLGQAISVLENRGHNIHAPLRKWLRPALLARGDRLYAWAHAQLSVDELDNPDIQSPTQRIVRDTLDSYVALGIDPASLLPLEVIRWYRRWNGGIEHSRIR